MKTRTLKSIYGVALMLALALGGVAYHSSASAARAERPGDKGESKFQGGKIEGTWRVQVTLRNCQTGAELRPAFPAMITFARGGTLTGTTTGIPPALRTPDHGIWRHTGGRTYKAVSEAFLFSPANAWLGTQRITQTIEIGDDPDQFTSSASVEIFGPNSEPIPGFPPVGCATAVARRME